MLVQVRPHEELEPLEQTQDVANVQYQHADFDQALANPQASAQGSFSEEEMAQMAGGTPIVRDGVKVGRNDPCPCGSGKKFKQCHGALS